MSANTYPTLFSLEGKPSTLDLVPPGHCQFGEDFASAKLVSRTNVSPSSSLLRFSLPDPTKPLQLSTCACILAKADIGGEAVIRPYTPISTNDMVGSMELLVKNYFDKGTMSKHLCELPVGSTIDFKHIGFNVKIQAPFKQKNVVLLAGGSGITPIIQALNALLGTNNNEDTKDQKVTLLYGSQSSDDIIAQPLLDSWAKQFPDKFQLVHVLSNEPEGSSWAGRRGHITKELLTEFLPGGPSPDTLILVCGPPPMYGALCGPRDQPEEITGTLGELGYTKDHVYKF
eukprot:Nitzschia sp. Nitz4//scaffold502_size4579//565//1422//NITZ4_009241-RA/size4579-processed-gene-0.1-mRNA-1//1//CDS//3329553594//1657//frame0